MSSNVKFIIINFCFTNVYIEKYDFESNIFLIQLSNESITNNVDIFDHWKTKYKIKIQEILNRHWKNFRNEFKKFNDDIEMFIFFRNETNIIDLKQNSYLFTIKNKKNYKWNIKFFDNTKSNSKNIVWNIFDDHFIDFRDLKKWQIKNNNWFKKNQHSILFERLFFFKQNIILKILNESIIFSFVNLTKNFF